MKPVTGIFKTETYSLCSQWYFIIAQGTTNKIGKPERTNRGGYYCMTRLNMVSGGIKSFELNAVLLVQLFYYCRLLSFPPKLHSLIYSV